MTADLSTFTDGARLMHELRFLGSGQIYRVPMHRLLDIQVPANPLDRQTPEYLIEFFKVRLPFYCRVDVDILGRYVDFYRPTADEMDRELKQERK